MTIEYEIDIKDVTSFYLYLMYRSPAHGLWTKIKRNWGIGLVVLFIVLGLIFAFVFQQYGMAVVGIVFASVVLIYYFVFRAQMVKNMVIAGYEDQPNRLTGKHKISINSESVTDLNELGQSVTHWKDINYLATYKDYLFIVLLDAEPYIVPQRAFSSNSDFDRFVQLAQQYHRATVK